MTGALVAHVSAAYLPNTIPRIGLMTYESNFLMISCLVNEKTGYGTRPRTDMEIFFKMGLR